MSKEAPDAGADLGRSERPRRKPDAREGAHTDESTEPDKPPRKSTHGLAAYVERAPPGTNLREVILAWEAGIPPAEVWE